MTYLVVLNDPPYGTERSCNGLRLANSLAKAGDNTVSVFLLGDAVWCGMVGQTTPDGYYSIERMLKVLASKKGKVGVCGSCMDARVLKPESLVQGARRRMLEELSAWTQEADKVIVF
jgi:uncharacterized protein involved in oxidation of intracellular sulfur